MQRLRSFFGVDRAIAFSVLNSARAMIAGPLIALLIALHFTPVVQGFYYTFSSVLALQVFAEMGLSAVLLQFASHEWAGLTIDRNGVHGRNDNLSRLASLMRLAIRWYGIAALISSASLMVGGYLFFRRQGGASIGWEWPWIALCALTGLKLFLTPFFSILEGCGQIKTVYAYRLGEGFLVLAVSASAITSGAGLWTAVAITAAVLCANVAFLVGRFGLFFRSVLRVKDGPSLDWRHEMLPMQWRIAVSWVTGYFVFQLFTPVLFNYQGPVVAGQFGLAWSLVNAISSVSTAWINTKVPQFGVLIARQDFQELDRMAWRATLGAVTVALTGSVAALLALNALGHWFPEIAARFLPLLPCALLLSATVLLQFSYAQSSYLRAHKREPFLWLSVVGAGLIGTSTWYFGSRHGATEMSWGYLAVVCCFSLPVGTVIFQRCRREWHTQSSAAA